MTAHPLPAGNPYVGPRPFEEADAQDGRYYGREREARDLLALVARERLVLFYAQSGAGKSSLLRASLIPGLRALGFDVLPIGRATGAAPAAAEPGVANVFVYDLIRSLNEGLPDRDRAAAGTLMKATLAQFLGGEAADDPDAASRLAPTVLLVDQFEEIVTGHPERWEDRAGFFEQLRDALERLPRLWVVLTLREDYVAPLEPYAELLPNRLRGRYYMQRMGQEAALEAVRRPAAAYGRPFAPDVAETLVDNLRRVRVPFSDEPELGEYVEPVQLQVVCQQLWARLLAEDEREGPRAARAPGAGPQPAPSFITEADLPLGHIDQALTRFYEDALAEVLADPTAQAAGTDERRLRTWFDRELITAEGMRSTVLRNEQTGHTGSLANTAVDRLARRYLVRTELRAGGAWVELVHDRFIEPIRTSNAAWFPQHLSPLQRQAALWDEQGRSDGLLLTGDALADAERWGQEHAAELAEEERDFLAACRAERQRAEQERQRSRRTRTLAIVAGIVSILAVAAIVSTFVARASAVVAFAQAATVQAQLQSFRNSAATTQAEATAMQQAAAAAKSEAHALQQVAATALADAAAAQKQAEAVVTQAVLQAQTSLAFTEAVLVANLTAQATPAPRVTPAAVATPPAGGSPTRPAQPPEPEVRIEPGMPQPPGTPTPNRTVIVQQEELARVRVTQTALAAPAVLPPKGRIIFVSNRQSREDLYVMNADGSLQQRWTFRLARDPDHTFGSSRLVFAKDDYSAGRLSIYIMPIGGGDEQRVTKPEDWNYWEPSISPDGLRIAAASSHVNVHSEILIIDLGGNVIRQVTEQNPARSWRPAWSPDGKQIAYASERGVARGRADMWLQDLTTDQDLRLTNNGAYNTDPAWSPDGLRIAFVSDLDGNKDVWVMDADGGNPHNLTRSPEEERYPAWSMDGNWLAFTRSIPDQEIFLMRSDGAQVRNLSQNTFWEDWEPVWVP